MWYAGPIKHSFRLGSTSFVLLDHIMPNVEWLAGKVDDVQLLLIEPDGDLPDGDQVERMRQIGARYDLSYTVHLPTVHLADAEETDRDVQAIASLIRLAKPLTPSGMVIHLYPAPPEEADSWVERGVAAVKSLADAAECDIALLEVENQVEHDLPPLCQIVERSGCSLCLDLGHVLMAGGDPLLAFDENRDRTQHLHLHGVNERDHSALTHFPRLKVLIERLRTFSGVVTVEVFGLEAFEQSMDAFLEACR